MRCKRTPLTGLLLGLWAALAGCLGFEPPGSAEIVARLQPGLSVGDVTRVTVSVSALDMLPRTVALEREDGQWRGTLGPIPAGTNRTITVEARGPDGTTLLVGRATDVLITEGGPMLVLLTLRPPSAPLPVENVPPIIDAVVASASGVAPGGSVRLSASAHDPNPRDRLTYVWTSSAGVFSAASSATTVWTGLGTPGLNLLTLTVIDSRGALVRTDLLLRAWDP